MHFMRCALNLVEFCHSSTWDNVRAECKNYDVDSDLIVLDSRQEHLFMQAMYGNPSYWAGLRTYHPGEQC